MFISNTASSISWSVRTDKSSMDTDAYFSARRLRASIFEDWRNMMCLARLEQEIIVAHLVSVLRRVVFAWKARMELNQEYQRQVLKYQKICEQLENWILEVERKLRGGSQKEVYYAWEQCNHLREQCVEYER